MRRSNRAALLIALLASFVGASAATAQESTTRGFNAGLHVSAASLKVENGDRSNAGGGGLILGYGFNRTFQLFLQLDGAEFDVADADVNGTWTMFHGDLGMRFHFANSLRTWVPYLRAALGGRSVTVGDAQVNQQAQASDVTFSGGALTLGGGIMFYFNQTLAADLQLAWTGGRFTDLKAGNVTLSGLEIDAQSSRFNVGISWWP